MSSICREDLRGRRKKISIWADLQRASAGRFRLARAIMSHTECPTFEELRRCHTRYCTSSNSETDYYCDEIFGTRKGEAAGHPWRRLPRIRRLQTSHRPSAARHSGTYPGNRQYGSLLAESSIGNLKCRKQLMNKFIGSNLRASMPSSMSLNP